MEIRDGFVATIGNTPLIKLRRASEETGCTILGKAEFLNPGGSGRAGSSSKAPPAIPGSASRWSATRAATRRSS